MASAEQPPPGNLADAHRTLDSLVDEDIASAAIHYDSDELRFIFRNDLAAAGPLPVDPPQIEKVVLRGPETWYTSSSWLCGMPCSQ